MPERAYYLFWGESLVISSLPDGGDEFSGVRSQPDAVAHAEDRQGGQLIAASARGIGIGR